MRQRTPWPWHLGERDEDGVQGGGGSAKEGFHRQRETSEPKRDFSAREGLQCQREILMLEGDH